MNQQYCPRCMNPLGGGRDVCPGCGARAGDYQPAPHHLRPGTVLGGKYAVGAVLGEGGFGITYIGRDINLDLRVAIKEYFPSGVVNRSNTVSSDISAHVGDAQAFFEKGKSRFLGEARTLAKFANEPSIVSVRDFFAENNTAYIVMEYLEGIDLKDYIAQHGKLSFAQTVAMLTPVMNALSKIHAQGLIHRDISPANIMILRDGTVKLLDFGAAREVGGADEKSLSILLKPGFAPEEQYRTKGHQGPWTDVYALSATMYKMMTGITPVDAMNRIFCDDLQPIPALNPTVTAAQDAIIRKGMAVQQGNRYQTVAELCDACRAACAADESRTVPAGTPAANDPRTVPVMPSAPASSAQGDWMNAWNTTPQSTSTRRKKSRPDAARTPENHPAAPRDGKKPSTPAFVGCIITGLLTLVLLWVTAVEIILENSFILPLVGALACGVATFFLGRLYFPRVDNKSKKPNVFCMVASHCFFGLTVYLASTARAVLANFWAQEGAGESWVVLAVLSLVFPIFFGYFWFPRLDRKKKKLFAKIYGGVVAFFVVLFVLNLIFTGLNTVTIGDQNIDLDETSVSLGLDILTDRDIENLKQLKKLESLEIFECLLDDDDVKALGELTQLKKLSLSTNTDITDVSPLAALTGLTYLNINNTNVSDISCLAPLTKLETLKISSTNVSDLSVLQNFTSLDELYMDSLGELDVSTIAFPASLRTLSCEGCGLTTLSFVRGSESLQNLYASYNNISDLTPLAGYPFYILHLAANNISDLSPLDVGGLSDLDVSTNSISDISCLRGIPAYQIDLSYNNVSDISAFTENYLIGHLDLAHNQITDISPLKDCFNIYSLDISFNRVVSLDVLPTLDDLTYFEARGNQITDISPLASCALYRESAVMVDLRDNDIQDLSPLTAFTKVEQIYLSNNRITDISPLAKCSTLEILVINNNEISDVSALGSLPAFRSLEIVNNPITDVSALPFTAAGEGVFERGVLRVSYDENIDFAKLAAIENLSVTIYDAPPRAKEDLRELGFRSLPDSYDDLDKVSENPDISAKANAEEGDNG